MPGLIARLSATPGPVRWAGRPTGADDPPHWARDDETREQEAGEPSEPGDHDLARS
jgi:hypothetical protein